MNGEPTAEELAAELQDQLVRVEFDYVSRAPGALGVGPIQGHCQIGMLLALILGQVHSLPVIRRAENGERTVDFFAVREVCRMRTWPTTRQILTWSESLALVDLSAVERTLQSEIPGVDAVPVPPPVPDIRRYGDV